MRARALAAALAALVLVVPLAEAVTFGSVQSSGSASAGTTRSVSAPAGIVAGHFLLAAVATSDGDGVTITPPSGWTLLGRTDNGGHVGLGVYYKVATAAEPSSYSWSFSKNTKTSIGIVRYVDVLTSNPFDGTATSALTNGASLVIPSMTTTAANSRVVAFVASATSTTITPAAGFTERYDQNGAVTVETADTLVPTAGATGAKTFTAANSARMAGGLIALRKAPTPTITLDKASSSAWESNGTARYWANLSVASQLTVTAAYTVAGTATAGGSDHTLAAGTLTFSPGQTSKGLNISVVNDATAEPNETVVLTLGSPTSATAGAIMTATHTIVNDDTTVGFVATASNAGEGAGTHAVSVVLGTASPRTVTVAYNGAAGTATSGADYATPTGTLTFAPWQTTAAIPATIAQDALDEEDETFSLSLSAPTNAQLTPSSHLVTIVDDDALPTVDLGAATSSVSEGASPSYTATLSAPSGRAARVAYAVTAGTASIPADLAAASGTLTFAPGETSKTFTVALVQDALDEADETYAVTLSAPENVSLGAAPSQAVTLVDDDAAPTVRFASAAASGSESGALPAAGVSLSAASGLPVTVVVSVSGGSATGADFTGGAAELSFAPGQTSASVPLSPIDDAVHEGDETIVLSLASATNAVVGAPSTHTLTLLDDEAPVTLRFEQGDASALESAGARSVTVILSGPAAAEVTVNYTLGGTAVAGEDFNAAAGALTFPPGVLSRTIPFGLVDDELVEPDETLVLTLADAVNASLVSPTHTLTILNDDVPYPTVSFATGGATLAEGAPSPAIVVALSAPHPRVATVQYAVGGTATPGEDFSLAAGSLVFEPGEITKSIPYTVVDDATVEPDETLVVTLVSPTRATLGTATFTRTIANDDLAPAVVSFAAATSSVAETAPSIAIRVQLDRAATSALTVQFAATGGTASGDAVDYALPPGALAFDVGESAKDIVVVLADDLVVEPTETLVVTLSGVVGGALGASSTHTLSITSDDVAPVTIAFAAASSAVAESVGTVDLVVLASNVAAESFEVAYSVTGGTASSGSDYSLPTGTLLFEPGMTSRIVSVQIGGDSDHEPDETIAIALSNPTYGALGSPATHVLTIQNDDAAPPTFAFATASASAAEAAGDVVVTVNLLPASATAATVNYAATGGSATAGVDYTLAGGTLSFAPGETSKTFTLRLLDDATTESAETIVLTLSSASGAMLGSSEQIFTILNDDAVLVVVQWSLAASTASEGAGSATILASLSASSLSAVTVAYSVTGGTANPADHSLASGTLTFAAGETTRSLSVPLVDDSAIEGDETLILTLASPTGATLGATTAHTLTILENDAPASSLIEVVATPVLADGSPHTGATWGGWDAEPGATNVGSVNYLKIVNTGTLASPRVVVAFAPSGFVGRTDASFSVPTASNLQFAWWEDTTPLSSSPSEGTFTFVAAGASPTVTLHFSGTGRIIYVAYRIVEMPSLLAAQPYDGSFTVTEL